MNPLSAPATPLPSIPAPSPRTAAPHPGRGAGPGRAGAVSAASAARAAPRSWKAATNASHRPTFLCHRRRRAADVPVPRGQRPAPGLSALVVSRLPLAPDVTQLVVELEDARPTPGCRDSMCSCCWKTAAGATSPSPTYRSPLRRTPCFGRYSFGRHNCEPRCFERHDVGRLRVARRRARCVGPVEFHIRRMPGGVFTDGILPRLAPGDALTLEGPLGACVWRGWLAPRCAGQFAERLIEWFTRRSGPSGIAGHRHGFRGRVPILMAALHDRRMASVTLYWGGRTPDDCYAAPLLNALQGKHAGLRWHAALSDTTREHAVELDGGGARTRSSASAPPRPGPGAGRRPRLDPQRGLRLRQSRDGARGPRPARRGGPAARALPVGSLPALGRRRRRRCAAAPRTCLGTRRPALHDGGHPGRAPALPGRRARHRRADPPRHDDARRRQCRRRPSARHGRLAQLASDLCSLRRRHPVAGGAADGFPARAAG